MLQRGKEFTRRSLVISCTIFGKDGKKNPFFHKPAATKEEYVKVQTGGKVV